MTVSLLPRARGLGNVAIVIAVAAAMAFPAHVASAEGRLVPEAGTHAGPDSLRADPIIIKLATLAPRGSAWHEILKQMGAEWYQASGGQVTLRIFPSGVAGEAFPNAGRRPRGHAQRPVDPGGDRRTQP